MDIQSEAEALLVACQMETGAVKTYTRALALMERLDPQKDAHAMYVATKYALARWMRRVSAHWASQGVRINAIWPNSASWLRPAPSRYPPSGS